MNKINFFTILSILQFFNLVFIYNIKPDINLDTIDIIWSMYFYSNSIIFIILMCSDAIYSKIERKENEES